MTKLNNLQRRLLGKAGQRQDHDHLPPKDNVDAKRAATTTTGLIESGLAEKVEIVDAIDAWRSNGETNFDVHITSEGEAALRLDTQPGPAESATAHPATRMSKATLVLQMLQRANGATLEELVQATGWLPHTTRAVLTGIRKNGHPLEKSKRDGLTCYRAGGDD